MHVLTYWLARLALMFAVFVALWGLGWTPWFAVLAAAVIAWLISYAMFGAMHDAAALQMERWVSRRFVGVAGDEVAEDAEATVGGAPRSPAQPKAASPAQPKPKPKVASPTQPKAASPAQPKAPSPARPQAPSPARPQAPSPATRESRPNAATRRSG